MSYSLFKERGILSLQASDQTTQLFAEKQSKIALQSRHEKDFFGSFEAKFPLRPLVLPLHAPVAGKIPLSLGYNAVWIETQDENLIASWKKEGLKVIAPSACADYFFCNAKGCEREELIREMKAQHQPLVFYIPKISASLLEELLDLATGKTIIAFDAFHEEQIHPIFSHLRYCRYTSCTPMLPIVNSGCIGKGEALWPYLNVHEQQQLFSYRQNYPFAGFAARTEMLPQEGSLLDCALWINGAMMWMELGPTLLLQSWLKAYKPFWPTEEALFLIGECEWVIQALLGLKNRRTVGHEKLKWMCDAIAARIQSLLAFCEKSGEFFDYVRYFVVDAKRLLQHTSLHLAVHLPPLLSADDPAESFWTSTSLQNPMRQRPFSGEGNPFLSHFYNQHYQKK